MDWYRLLEPSSHWCLPGSRQGCRGICGISMDFHGRSFLCHAKIWRLLHSTPQVMQHAAIRAWNNINAKTKRSVLPHCAPIALAACSHGNLIKFVLPNIFQWCYSITQRTKYATMRQSVLTVSSPWKRVKKKHGEKFAITAENAEVAIGPSSLRARLAPPAAVRHKLPKSRQPLGACHMHRFGHYVMETCSPAPAWYAFQLFQSINLS